MLRFLTNALVLCITTPLAVTMSYAQDTKSPPSDEKQSSAGKPLASKADVPRLFSHVLPTDVPPVIGSAIGYDSSTRQNDDYEQWSIRLSIAQVAWTVVGERRPKLEWPEFKVKAGEKRMTLSMGYHPATQLSDIAQNRIVDRNGRRLARAEALKLLKESTPVLVSVSGRMPDPYYLQCTLPDSLIVILGIPAYPAPELLLRELTTSADPQTQQEGRTQR